MKTEKKTKQKSETNQVPWMCTLPAAADMSRLPLYWLRKLVQKGELPCYKAGDRIYINVDELKEVIKTTRMR